MRYSLCLTSKGATLFDVNVRSEQWALPHAWLALLEVLLECERESSYNRITLVIDDRAVLDR